MLCFFALLALAPNLSAAATDASTKTSVARSLLAKGTAVDFGQPPPVPTRPLSTKTRHALDTAFGDFGRSPWGKAQSQALRKIGETKDPRLGWLLADALMFVGEPTQRRDLLRAMNKLLGLHLNHVDAWSESVDHLIAWDIPAPPDYLAYKRAIYVNLLREWAPLFRDGSIDWRHVAWGGVRIDDREFDDTDRPCNCIPAADNPPVTTAAEAQWLADDDVVFGVSINGEHRAYPRQIMEVREMVNDTLGGRHLGIPYCTLCGSMQAWFTDQMPPGIERPVLRTSGLLIRSNKVMYDLVTGSVFDTFRGLAVTGPLAERKLALSQASVVTTSWGQWKAAHPTTTVLAERLALGRNFDFRNGRDANGPIFPIGNVDPRLAVQADVLGVIPPSGEPIAFHVPSIIKALDAGETISVDDVRVILDGGGVRAVTTEGKDLGTHQAFWFAWSQFYPQTRLWAQ